MTLTPREEDGFDYWLASDVHLRLPKGAELMSATITYWAGNRMYSEAITTVTYKNEERL